jgi:outer membrane protein OmpA-like peptidoglycan-associated protein
MTANDYAHGWSAGLLNTFKVSKRVAVNLEVGMNLSDDRLFDAAQTTHSDYGTYFTGFDRSFSAELGLTLNIGKTGWKKSPDVDAIKALSQQEIDALNNRLRAAEDSKAQLAADKDAKIANLERALAACQSAAANTPKPTAAVVEKKSAYVLQPMVVFRKNVSTIDASQYPSVEMIAKYMKSHPDAKILIKGYASPEGNMELNKTLSKARAEEVRKALINRYKIAAERLSAEGFGPTNDLFEEPEFNRIVTFSNLE